MFEVKRDRYINKTFRLKEELVEELEQYAAAQQVSMNQLVAQCCQYALENKKDSAGEEQPPPSVLKNPDSF